jgi:hypothetical protein
MKESVVTFGEDVSLVGVLCEPEERAPNAVVVVMSNVGLNHRVGPSRVWVELARRLAKEGIPSFRFDASGLGDSAPRHDRLDDVERAVLDLRTALDWLSANVGDGFVLVSLCSGTDNAHPISARDARVKAAIFIDGYNYPTLRFHFERDVLRWVSPHRWRRFLRRRFPEKFGLEVDARGRPDEIFKREFPERSRFENDLATMVDRGMHLLFIFSGETNYAYRDQFWDWLERKDWNGRITVEYRPRANHTFTFLEERSALLELVVRWILSLAVVRAAVLRRQASSSTSPP